MNIQIPRIPVQRRDSHDLQISAEVKWDFEQHVDLLLSGSWLSYIIN